MNNIGAQSVLRREDKEGGSAFFVVCLPAIRACFLLRSQHQQRPGPKGTEISALIRPGHAVFPQSHSRFLAACWLMPKDAAHSLSHLLTLTNASARVRSGLYSRLPRIRRGKWFAITSLPARQFPLYGVIAMEAVAHQL